MRIRRRSARVARPVLERQPRTLEPRRTTARNSSFFVPNSWNTYGWRHAGSSGDGLGRGARVAARRELCERRGDDRLAPLVGGHARASGLAVRRCSLVHARNLVTTKLVVKPRIAGHVVTPSLAAAVMQLVPWSHGVTATDALPLHQPDAVASRDPSPRRIPRVMPRKCITPADANGAWNRCITVPRAARARRRAGRPGELDAASDSPSHVRGGCHGPGSRPCASRRPRPVRRSR